MKKEEIEALLAENKRLHEENTRLKKEKATEMNPLYRELLDHLILGPKTISQLCELMTRDNRTISQWLHQLKQKYGAEIITLGKGEKQLANPEYFLNTPE